ncbi:MAG TPA: multicopper oxidase domain-containing protein, partial [Gemmatimonadaceae bacterium]|nr:multicopper oxidase domain-containing protein [Gemmatimonadaceae bacterium]
MRWVIIRQVRAASASICLLAAPCLPGAESHGQSPVPRASAAARPDRITPNDNRAAAGSLREGELTVRLELRRGRWYPEADDGRSEEVLVFAEAGGAPSIPGPLVRVPAGTRVRATVRNTLRDASLTVHGLGGPARSALPVVVPPGAEREVRFTAGEPGTYFYWGSTSGAGLEERTAEESQLYGAIVVDSAGAPHAPDDRVFVVGVWSVPPDTTGPEPRVPRDMMVINGKTWPFTERFTFAVGDTVRWRWLNPTTDAHPMHLHGFYFTVGSRGTWSADTVYREPQRRLAVTETMLPGGTMTMQWVPSAAGNWLVHCHFAFHVSHLLSFDEVPEPADPGAPGAVEHHADAMRGLVLGIHVRAPAASRADTASLVPAPEPRRLRLLAQAAPRRYGAAAGYGYVLDDGRAPGPRDSVPRVSPTLVLRRGEPVRITVVNHLRAPTAVHWHGIEIQDSYSDGVPGWSGQPDRLAPAVAPADSFVATFTPTRSGTFIYHAHSNEAHQIGSGLYGPLLVLEPGAARDTTLDRTFVIGGNGPDFATGRV